MILRLYSLGWQIALPFLRRNPRIAEGFEERINGPLNLMKPVDLWIQAASAGESYLACALLEKLLQNRALKILITTNTRQGFDILQSTALKQGYDSNQVFISYFPFDSPDNMEKIVNRLHPRITILLETEIWPGLLVALKNNDLPTIILNGRLSPKSLQHYLLYPRLFKAIAPTHILSISKADARRFTRLFPTAAVDTMPNIKFDRILFSNDQPVEQNPLLFLFGKNPNLVVLGSVREEEEPYVEKIISKLLNQLPQIRIALFPRHMHRLKDWQQILSEQGWDWHLRSAMTKPISPGAVILWDTFGELSKAYALATTVFVGGSLAKLGGQNFLEPLAYGVQPVIGPSWNNFFWIGEEIFTQNLVQRCADWQTVATALINNMVSPTDPNEIKNRAQTYIQNRQGGTIKACSLIRDLLSKGEIPT
jgi:3-deoxy-D-manno-octulosonic-acid transferase